MLNERIISQSRVYWASHLDVDRQRFSRSPLHIITHGVDWPTTPAFSRFFAEGGDGFFPAELYRVASSTHACAAGHTGMFC
jgi:hypothetical protein